MSMGNIESYYQVVPETVMKKVVGKSKLDHYSIVLNALTDGSEAVDSDVDEAIADDFEYTDLEVPIWANYKAAYDDIVDTFKQKTGMTVYAKYLEGDGDCYDDLDSDKWYWMLAEDDVWIRKMTPQAAEFCKKYGTKKTPAIDTDERFSRYG